MNYNYHLLCMCLHRNNTHTSHQLWSIIYPLFYPGGGDYSKAGSIYYDKMLDFYTKNLKERK